MTARPSSAASAGQGLAGLVREEIVMPVLPQVADLARAIAARHGPASRAVLFYGSCLRERELDGRVLDFYLVVSSYREAYGAGWLAFANRLIPPNVFSFRHEGFAAKYAVLSEADFARACAPAARDVSVWARFSQPSRLAWVSDVAVTERMVESVSQAAPVLVGHALAMVAPERSGDPLAVWSTGFELTYACELRAERADRPAAIVAAEPDRYVRFGNAIRATGAAPLTRAEARARWLRLRRRGRLLNALRLLKAATTYNGGLDYIVFKINRHAGTSLELRPWQRRWPVIGAVALLPRVLKRGVIR